MLAFVLPEDRTAISGGNLYNERLLAALSSLGTPHRVTNAIAPGDHVAIVDSVLLPEVPRHVASAGTGTRVFVLVHHFASFGVKRERAGLEEREREALRGVTGFVTTSPFATGCLARLRDGRPTFSVPPALAVKDLAPPRELRAPGFRGLLVGNLTARKGVLRFLEELGARVTPSDAFTLSVVGRTDLEPAHAAAVAEFLAGSPPLRDRVKLCGALPSSRIPATYHEHSVAISASEFETYGMAMHEARASGLPLFALPTGFASKLVTTPAHGKLCADHAALADACVAAIRGPEAFARLQRAAHDAPYVSAWTWERAARSLCEQLRSWLP